MAKRALWIALTIGMMAAGCGIKEDLEGVKQLNDAPEQQVGGDPHVNYSKGTEGKVIVVKFFGKLKDPDTAAATTRKLVDTHLKQVDKLEIWRCTKEPSGMESCVGM